MSMAEAVKAIRARIPDWMVPSAPEEVVVPRAPTPAEDAEALVVLARSPARVDRQSSTWMAVAAWAATELIKVQAQFESAPKDQFEALQSRARTLRDLLACDQAQDSKQVIEEQRPFVI